MSMPHDRLHYVGSWLAAGLLVIYVIATLSAWSTKTVTFDETAHLAGGYGYWVWQNYDLQPENGNLPQRLGALPIVLMHGSDALKDAGMNEAKSPDVWMLGQILLFDAGLNAEHVLFWSRAAMVLLACALGWFIFAWSRRLYGTMAGLFSLLLFTLCPQMLANGPLVASDIAAAFFFLVSAYCIWWLLHHVSVASVLVTGLALGGLALSKMSAPLIVPTAVLLLVFRVYMGRPLKLSWRGRTWCNRGQVQRMGVNIISLLLACAIAWGVLWSAFSWQFDSVEATLDPQLNEQRWEWVDESSGFVYTAIDIARTNQLLPESYLYGFAYTMKMSEARSAFMRGEVRGTGWVTFFPFAFAVKTPLPILFLIVAALSLFAKRFYELEEKPWYRKQMLRGFYVTAPLWFFMAVYLAAALSSSLNLGVRHLLPVYAAVYILLGCLAAFFVSRHIWLRVVMWVVVLVLAVESLLIWPNYIAYFNQTVGGSRQGYHHLVDSSLDWGQDLPALARWQQEYITAYGDELPLYLSYFGNGRPLQAGVNATLLPGFSVPRNQANYQVVDLQPGLYAISATMLQGVYFQPTWGTQWTPRYQSTYEKAQQAWETLQQLDGNAQAQYELFERIGVRDAWALARLYAETRMAKLAAYLREHKDPIAQPGYSILVYELTQEELKAALK